jgi:hypothetical protein
VQFRIGCPNPPGTCTWNPANDYSFQGLTSTGLVRTRNIVAFDGAQRVWGDEPGQGSPDFALSASPAAVSVTQGSTATSTIAITRTSFTASVDLSASGLPTGVTAAFSPDPTTGNSSVVTFTAAAAATTGGPVNVTISGTGGTPALTRTTTDRAHRQPVVVELHAVGLTLGGERHPGIDRHQHDRHHAHRLHGFRAT